jgi:hypothetical protein
MHVFLTSALVIGEWSDSRPIHFTPGIHWIEGWMDPRACLDNMEKLKFLTLPRFELQPPVQSVVIRYTTEYRVHTDSHHIQLSTFHDCTSNIRHDLLSPTVVSRYPRALMALIFTCTEWIFLDGNVSRGISLRSSELAGRYSRWETVKWMYNRILHLVTLLAFVFGKATLNFLPQVSEGVSVFASHAL